MLYAHNQVVFDDLCDALKTHNKVMVLACTGHGKTYIIKELLEKTEQRALVICTGKEIKENWKSLTEQIDAVTYSGFSRMENPSAYPIVIIDEAHHTGARVWGAKITEYMTRHPATKFIGLTADAKRYSDGGRDMTDELFDGNAVYGLTLSEAIAQGVLPPFKYVCAWIQVESKVKELREKLNGYSGNKAILDKLISKLQYTAENSDNISRILNENMPTGARKGIIFVDSIANIEEGVKIAQDNFSSPVWKIHSEQSDFVNQKNRNAFDDAKKGWLVTVNKVNEGLHLNAVNTIIMLRRTQSPTVFFQQLGRAMSINNFGKDVVIFDFVGNHRTLKTIAVEAGEFLGLAERDETANGKIVQVIIDSYTQEALELLKSIEKKLAGGWPKEEDEYLITHYHTDGTKKCANMLGRTEAAVFARAVILGLTKPMVRWTHEQEEYLIEHYQTNAAQKCADILGKTKNAVQGKAGTLGLTRIKVDWTHEQDEYLAEHYLTDGAKKCAEALGRTYSSIQNRVRKLGLTTQRRRRIIIDWLPEHEEYLVEHFQTDGAQKCADALGRTIGSVQRRASLLGLTKSRKKGDSWLPEHDEYLAEHYLTDGAQKCAEALGRTSNAVSTRARILGLSKHREKKTSWTPKQKEYLVEHYQTDGVKKCANALKKTENAVRYMTQKLGLTKKQAHVWTLNEKEYLTQHYQFDGISECANILGRSTNAVKNMASKLGLTSTPK